MPWQRAKSAPASARTVLGGATCREPEVPALTAQPLMSTPLSCLSEDPSAHACGGPPPHWTCQEPPRAAPWTSVPALRRVHQLTHGLAAALEPAHFHCKRCSAPSRQRAKASLTKRRLPVAAACSLVRPCAPQPARARAAESMRAAARRLPGQPGAAPRPQPFRDLTPSGHGVRARPA